MKPIFILGQASLSPQGSYITDPLPEHPVQYDTLALTALEPDYKGVIGPVEIRRMNRSMKMGVWCAKKALEQAGLEGPDAIITGSGLGCLQDTVNFLKVMLDSEESASAPTFFISSTHNSVGGQLALRLQCTGYNFTYCHKSLSLYSALLDAMLHLEDHPGQHILVGALDEHVEEKFRHYALRDWWRRYPIKNMELFSGKFQGTISGEGCHYFVLGSKGKPQSVALMDMRAAEQPSRAEIE
ncbi:MAG: beta-ketoacyl synthase chain length factor, partial [Flavobacteriales bacterium]|nr:beta-ketoacyl synthase chain length factor [Flavobacteriales bacterium]